MDNPIHTLPAVRIDLNLTGHRISELIEENLPTLQQTTVEMQTALNTLSARVDTVASVVNELETTVSDYRNTGSAGPTILTFVSEPMDLVFGGIYTLNHGWNSFRSDLDIVVFSYEIVNKEAERGYNPGDRVTTAESFTATVTDTAFVIRTLFVGIFVYDLIDNVSRKVLPQRWSLVIKAVGYAF